MKQLKIDPQIERFDSFAEFIKGFDIGEKDLIFTGASVFNRFIKPLGLRCDVLLRSEFGTGEPSDEMVNAVYRAMGDKRYDRVIAVGGGSVIDIGKLLCVKRANDINDFYDGKAKLKKESGLILVPTTCGAGSEVTSISVIYRTKLQTKQGLSGSALSADYAVLIPELLEILPYEAFVYSAIDALIHAVESFLSPKASSYTSMFSEQAIRSIIKGFQRVAQEGPQARMQILGDFLVASNYAGIAFGNAGCAAVHAMSYPLGGVFHVAHGESNYALFTAILKTYYAIAPHGLIKAFNSLLAELLDCAADSSVYDALQELLGRLIPRKPLGAYGMTKEQAIAFSYSVMEQQQRLLANNYVPLSRATVEGIYLNLL
ncbi:MAG: 4-hydroxybutyrate dehydrogenase [Christensenellales bacterium]